MPTAQEFKSQVLETLTTLNVYSKKQTEKVLNYKLLRERKLLINIVIVDIYQDEITYLFQLLITFQSWPSHYSNIPQFEISFMNKL